MFKAAEECGFFFSSRTMEVDRAIESEVYGREYRYRYVYAINEALIVTTGV